MSGESKLYWLIEDYLSGELRGDALDSFKKELTANPSLANQVKLHQMANDLVIERRLADVKNILQNQRTNPGKPWKAIIGISTGILLLSSALYFWKSDNKEDKSPNIVSKESYEGKKISISNRSKSGNNKIETASPKVTNRPTTTNEENSYYPSPVASNEESEPLVHQPVPNEHMNTSIASSPMDPCINANITASVHPTASCEGENNGAIQITELKGDHPPLHYSIQDKHGDNYKNTLNLHSGIYSIKITDNKGCSKDIKNIEVPAKACEKDYEFNPFTGNTWAIPTNSKTGTLHIYDHSNTLIFEKEIKAETEEQWDGTSRSGEINTGYYIYIIKYKDGSYKKGSVTIVR